MYSTCMQAQYILFYIYFSSSTIYIYRACATDSLRICLWDSNNEYGCCSLEILKEVLTILVAFLKMNTFNPYGTSLSRDLAAV